MIAHQRKNLDLQLVFSLLLLVVMMLPTRAHARRQRGPLPTPVAKVIRENFPNATVKSFGKERESSVMYYEVNLRYKGNRIEVEVAPDGSIGEVEANVAIEDVPASVLAALKQKIGNRRIVKIEKHERWGRGRNGRFEPLEHPRISYEAKYISGGRRRETKVRYEPAKALTAKAKIAITERFANAQIRDAQLKKIQSVKLFAVVLADGSDIKNVMVTMQGVITEIADDVQASQLPMAVAQAVRKVAGRYQIIGLEEVQVLAELTSGKVSELKPSRMIYRVHLLQGNKTA